jgi:DNA-binding response OmpR family regulator
LDNATTHFRRLETLDCIELVEGRRKLDGGEDPACIRTERGMGYRFGE